MFVLHQGVDYEGDQCGFFACRCNGEVQGVFIGRRLQNRSGKRKERGSSSLASSFYTLVMTLRFRSQCQYYC